MTDDFAVDGQDGAYVPCDELAAELDADEEGAISGLASGYVAQDQLASALPAQEREAIVGSAVGFVAAPCGCVGTDILVIDDFGRVVGVGWSDATGPDYNVTTPAGTWVKSGFGPTTESVDGDIGHSTNSGAFALPNTNMTLPLPVHTSWFVGKAWIECRWLVKTTIGNQVWGLYSADLSKGVEWFTNLDGTVARYGRFQSNAHTFNTSFGSGVNVSGTPFWAALRLEAGVVEFKQWPDGSAEPATWEGSITGATLGVGDIARCHFENGQSGPAGVRSVDYIEATVPC